MIDCPKSWQEPHRITYTNYKGSWDFGVRHPENGVKPAYPLYQIFFTKQNKKKERKKKTIFALNYFLLNKKQKISQFCGSQLCLHNFSSLVFGVLMRQCCQKKMISFCASGFQGSRLGEMEAMGAWQAL